MRALKHNAMQDHDVCIVEGEREGEREREREREYKNWECLFVKFVGKPWLELLTDRVQLLLLHILLLLLLRQ